MVLAAAGEVQAMVVQVEAVEEAETQYLLWVLYRLEQYLVLLLEILEIRVRPSEPTVVVLARAVSPAEASVATAPSGRDSVTGSAAAEEEEGSQQYNSHPMEQPLHFQREEVLVEMEV